MKLSSVLIVLVVLAVLAGGAFFLFRPRQALPPDPLAVVPADAYGVVRVQVEQVLASDAYQRLVVERGLAKGIERVTKTCGFNPLAKVHSLTVFARPAPDGGVPRFAFAAQGDLDPEALGDCVRKFSRSGAALKRDDIKGIPCVVSTQGASRACFLRDGALGGDSESVRASLYTILGAAGSVAADSVLSSLFREVEAGTDVALVARVPEQMRPLLRTLGQAFGDGSLMPLSDVRALSASLNLAGGRLAGGVVLLAPDAPRARGIIALAQTQVTRFLAIPGISMTPAGGVLRGIQMESLGDRATFTGSVNVSTVEALLELMPALQQFQGLLSGQPTGMPTVTQIPSPGAQPPGAAPQGQTPPGAQPPNTAPQGQTPALAPPSTADKPKEPPSKSGAPARRAARTVEQSPAATP